ncbi:MAG TPA: TonB family protein [Opitutaceae bacterium]
MPTAENTQIILSLTPFSLHALRAANGTIEAGGECSLDNKAALEALLDAVAPSRAIEGITAATCVWPSPVSWYVSTDTEAMLDRTGDALRAIAAGKQKDPQASLAYAACNAGDGGLVTEDGIDKWVLAFSSVSALEKASTALLELKVDPEAVTPAAFANVGAICEALRLEGTDGAVVLWDLGDEQSNLLLVTAKGIAATASCTVAMESVYEAVQTALKLKFRGAGARLFFNDSYDFTDPGPRIATSIAPALKEALAQLPTTPKPPGFACPVLTGKQEWFVRETAIAAGLVPWQTDIAKLAASLGLKFSEAAVEALFSPFSIGLLELLSVRARGSAEWTPDWIEAEGIAEEEAAPAPPEEMEPEPAPMPVRPKPSLPPETSSGAPRPPKPIVRPKAVTAPPPQAPAPQPAEPLERAPYPEPALAPPAPPPAPPRSASPAPAAAPMPPPPEPNAPPAPPPQAPLFTTISAPQRPPSFSNPGFPPPSGLQAQPPPAPAFTAAPRPIPPAPIPPPPPAAPPLGGGVPTPRTAVPAPAAAITALPFDAASKTKPFVPRSVAKPVEPPPPPPEAKSKVPLYIGILVVVALLAVGIAVVLEARMEKTRANDLEQQEAIAHHVAEQRLKEAEQNATSEAERTRKALEDAVALAKQQTEAETRRAMQAEEEAARVAKLPGTIVLATVPAGASVSIDGAAPVASPVHAEGLASGSHKVQISLQGFESVDMTADVAGGKTTDLGSVVLQSVYGTVNFSSIPDGLEFAVRPAADPAGKPIRAGRTPATLADVPHGDFLVTFTRPGCRDHVEKVSVTKGATSPVSTKYLDGSLELESDPSGASVNEDGTFLGTTPLVLHDLTPKEASFDLSLPGYDPTPVTVQIPEGDTLKFSAQILRKDRIFKPSEVKTPPTTYEAPPPVLSSAQRKQGAEVLLSLVVRRDGAATGVEVVRSSDDDIARRCKKAVEKWRFRPATAPDDRTVDARIEIPFKFPAVP